MCTVSAPCMQADRAAAEAYGADALISALRKVKTTCMGLHSPSCIGLQLLIHSKGCSLSGIYCSIQS